MSNEIEDDRKRPAKGSAGSPLPKRSHSRRLSSTHQHFNLKSLDDATTIRYNDEIHRSIDICPLMKVIMDTRPVQRLRDLNQLGTVHLVYACATHTRFDHSIGVAHLAKEMCERLRSRHPEYGVTKKDVLCVTLAGLLHDTGHGPFSHLYEGFREEVSAELVRNPERRKAYQSFEEVSSDWSHERSSLMMVDEVLKELGLEIDMNHLDEPLAQIGDGVAAKCIKCYWADASEDDKASSMTSASATETLTSRDWIFIKEAIYGGPIPEVYQHLQVNERIGRTDPRLEWLYDIVSNRHNGIDVDKVDYFARDARRCLNDSGNVDVSITNEACIAVGDCANPLRCKLCKAKQYHHQICYPKKCVQRVIKFYQKRGDFHASIYQHKTNVAAGCMVSDILKKADLFFLLPTEKSEICLPISRAFVNPHAFERLRDGIVDSIAFSSTPELKEARDLALRYKRRDLYKMSSKKTLDLSNPRHKHIWQEVKKKPNEVIRELCSMQAQHVDSFSGEPIKLEEDDIILKCVSWHQGKGAKNPLSFVRFVDKSATHRGVREEKAAWPMAKKVDEEEFSMILSRTFQENVIRAYCRDPKKRELLAHVFETFWANAVEPNEIDAFDGIAGPSSTPFATTFDDENSDASSQGEDTNAVMLTQEQPDSEDEAYATPTKASSLKVASPSPIPIHRRSSQQSDSCHARRRI